MSVQWTKEQQKVIDLRDRNILVSAAAGSGKTAVLVERIIQRLMEKENPLDVDRLLIVTFTEAAAAEMKERIRDAIEKALEEEPENVHLQRQSTLIHSAQITTIHSFCLSVIREHFHVIDLDPGFRIAEEGELKLMRQDVLNELLEDFYIQGDNGFLEFVEKFGTGRSDKKIEELILTLYEYSLSYPQQEIWLAECAEAYRIEGQLEDAVCFQKAEQFISQHLTGAEDLIHAALKICEEPDGPYMYGDALETDLAAIEKIQKASGFCEMYEAVSATKWKRLSTKKDETVSADKRDAVKAVREKVKKMVKEIQSSYFYEEPKELVSDMSQSYETMQILVSLVREFSARFSEKKRNKNVIDFSDMEQFALRILTEEKDGKLVPSMSAMEYQEQFEEVMIDEYQDSNLIQEAILTSVSTVSRGKPNIFMVGDVKQSIYRFRLSRPELFMQKYDTYSLEDSKEQRIDLHKNFRSRTEVLDAANYVFEQIMQKEVGGILYDEKAALYPGADYAPSEEQNGSSVNQAELLLLDPEEVEWEEENVRRLEAWAAANRIKKLVCQTKVLDKKTKEYRQAQYRDIVILTRSIKGWADVFASVLAEEGIPAYVGSREGYFETYEVSVLLDYLKVLDNQRQDLPLTAVLTSPFAGLEAAQLAEIRSTYPDMMFYEAVRAYAQKESDEKPKDAVLQKRLYEFLEQISCFREMLPYTPMHELLWKIIEETGYGIYIEAMPGGEQRIANVEMLIQKAASYEGTSYKGLFNFVRYIEQLKKYDVDYGEANISDEQSDTVRIMSIHKSKGLEFPIVIVAGMGKKFNMQDVTGNIVLHPKLGVGVDAVDLERRTKIPTLLKKVIQEEVKVENLGEEMRVLYVAMTRAKEKLIMTGVYKGAKELLESYRRETAEKFPVYQLLQAKSYLDWVLPAVMRENSPIAVSVADSTEEGMLELTEERAGELAKDVLQHWDTSLIHDAEFKEKLEKQLGFVYGYEEEKSLKMKFTVSELKKREYLAEEAGEIVYEEPEIIPLLPRFLEKETTLSGASRGSAYHKVMELLDFSKEYDLRTLKETIQGLQEEERISEEMAESIRLEDVLKFLCCNSGRRMQRAAQCGKLYKEQPFVLGAKPQEVYPDTKSEELVLVQGIIDVYFEEEDGLVLLDYKTDKVRKAEELREKYHTQLEYYGKALEQLLQKRVKEKIIYSFTLRQEIEV